MPEHQNIEYKQAWHNDYLKTVCGFANSNGGSLLLGINDNGESIGISDHRKLMDDIPNKVRNFLGITVDVDLLERDDKQVIEIRVEQYSVPISLRGRYYFRSGSSTQELIGTSLNDFLLKRSGRTWDDEIEPRASLDDIDKESILRFAEVATRAGRLPNDIGSLSVTEILEKLRLTVDKKLKRAAIILFGKDPGKFYPNTFFKIGRFGKDSADLRFQEVEEGNLITLLPAVLNQLSNKFLTKAIHFEGMHRIEEGEYPTAAIREMILNALVHRNYMGAPIQMRVFDNKISIWNEGRLPEGLTIEALKGTHSSMPRNPIIADVAFKGGYIDAWGRGTIRVLKACADSGLPEPEIIERDGGISLTLFQVLSDEHIAKMGLNERQMKAIGHLRTNGSITKNEYRSLFEISDRSAVRDLHHLVSIGLLVISGIGKSTSYSLKNGA